MAQPVVNAPFVIDCGLWADSAFHHKQIFMFPSMGDVRIKPVGVTK